MECSGNAPRITARIAASLSLSAMVTGVRSGLVSTRTPCWWWRRAAAPPASAARRAISTARSTMGSDMGGILPLEPGPQLPIHPREMLLQPALPPGIAEHPAAPQRLQRPLILEPGEGI